MIYTYENAPRSEVYDVEGRRKLTHVVSVDTESGEVVMDAQPLRLTPEKDGFERITARYRSVHPIFGGARRPVLFHCYGLKS